MPESATECGLPEALSLIVKLPILVPPAVGLKVTLIAQFVFAVTEVLHVLVSAKSPLEVMPETLNEAFPLLNKIIVSTPLVAPTVWPENVRLEGERLTTGPMPIPVM